MGSYGIGLERLLACVAEEHRDDHGLVLPVTVAPYQVALVALARKEETWRAPRRCSAHWWRPASRCSTTTAVT